MHEGEAEWLRKLDMARLRIPIRMVGAAAESPKPDPGRWETGWPALQNVLVRTAADLAAARVLRRESFQPAGGSFTSDIACDDLDAAPNSRIFLLYEENRPAGTVRVMNGDPRLGKNTFFSRYFAAEIAALAGGYVEVTQFAIARPFGCHDPRHVLALLQNVTSEADRTRATSILTALDPDHQSFYAASGFRPVSDTRRLPGWPYEISLGILDWAAERDRLRESYTFRRCFCSRNHIQSPRNGNGR